MKVFTPIYDRVIRWSSHRLAVRYLAFVSFLESIIFPVPADILLTPMALAKPHRAWFFAAVTTLASVVGGVLTFALGFFAINLLLPWIENVGYLDSYREALVWFTDYGFWGVFIAGFSPIPFKILSVTAGALQMAILPFILASAVGRAGRFFLLAGLIYWGGEAMEQKLRAHIDIIGWLSLTLLVIVSLVYVL